MDVTVICRRSPPSLALPTRIVLAGIRNCPALIGSSKRSCNSLPLDRVTVRYTEARMLFFSVTSSFPATVIKPILRGRAYCSRNASSSIGADNRVTTSGRTCDMGRETDFCGSLPLVLTASSDCVPCCSPSATGFACDAAIYFAAIA